MDEPKKCKDFQDLTRRVLEHKCVAFIGAGVAPYGSGDDKWRWLAIEMAKKCKVPHDANLKPIEIVDKCLDNDIGKCNMALRELFPRYQGITREAIGFIHNLKFPALLTTNFDLSIKALSRFEQYQGTLVYPDLPLFKDGVATVDKRIFYLHGIFDSENKNDSVEKIVLGSKSFREAYENSLLPSFLTQVFVFLSVLFVGFNPREERIGRILKQAADIRLRLQSNSRHPVVRHFVLWPDSYEDNKSGHEKKVQDLDEFQAIGVTPVLYDPGENYTGIDKILERWVNEGDRGNRPAPFEEGYDNA